MTVHMLRYHPRGGGLASLPHLEFIDGRVDQICLVDETPEIGLSSKKIENQKRATYLLGRPVLPEKVPTKLAWMSKGSPDDYFTPRAFPCVSDTFRKLIERLEPNVHQFFPLEVVNRREEHVVNCWLWVVCQRIDSLDRAETTMVLYNNAVWLSPAVVYAKQDDADKYKNIKAKIVFNSSQIAGRDFWRDSFLMDGLWCSSAAAELIQKAGLVGTKLIPQETV